MRRAPFVLAGTAAGMAAVLTFKPHQPTLATAAPAPSSTPAATAAATATPSRTVSGTATGDAIPTPYGNAQVKVTVKDGKITDVVALQLQGDDPKSVAISSYAEPLLRASALTKQSANIDMVSGATFTSQSYEASLQSALDKLGYKAPDGSRGAATVTATDGHDGRR